jgi:hypothetical protein
MSTVVRKGYMCAGVVQGTEVQGKCRYRDTGVVESSTVVQE